MQDQPQQEPTLKEKTAKGLFWGGISTFIQQLVGAGLNIVIMRILSPDDYGLIGMLLIFTAIANTLMDSGFTVALVNKKEIRHEDYNAVFWFSVLLGITIYIILFFAAPLIARFYGKPVLINLSRLLFLGFLISSMGFAHNAILFKKLMIKERAKIDIAAVTVSGSVGLILAFNGFAYWGLAIQAICMSGIAVILRWRFAPWKPSFRHIDLSPLKSMIGFSSKLLVTNVFGQVSGYISSVVLGRVYSETEVGYYTRGNYWMQLGNTVISGMITSVAQPVFVETNTDKERQLQIFRKMLRFGAFVSFPAMFGLAFIGREFILIAVGEKWIETVPIFQIFCIYGGLAFLTNMYYQLLLSFGKSNVVMWYYILFSVLALFIAVITSGYGMQIMAIAYVALSILSIGGWHFFAAKLIGLSVMNVVKDITPYLGITIGCFLMTWFLTQSIENIYLLFIAKILLACIFYVSIVWFSGSVILKEGFLFLMSRWKK